MCFTCKDVMKIPVQSLAKKLVHRKTTFLLIKFIISICLLIYLFRRTDIKLFYQSFLSVHPGLFLFSAILYIGCQYLSSFRWKVLLTAHKITVSTPKLFSFYLVGMFFNNFMPTSIGGDVVKGYDLYKHTQKGKESITTVFLERYTGIIALLLIGLLSLIFIHSILHNYLVATLMLGMTLAFILGTIMITNRFIKKLSINIASKFKIKKLEKVITEIYETFGRYKHHKDSFINAILLSIIIQVMNVFVYVALSYSLDIKVPLGLFFLFIPVITLISMMPISVNGLGVREATNVYLFAQVGVGSSHALSLSLSWFFMVSVISLLGGFIFIFRKQK